MSCDKKVREEKLVKCLIDWPIFTSFLVPKFAGLFYAKGPTLIPGKAVLS